MSKLNRENNSKKIDANEIVKNILKRRKKKLESRVINKEKNKKTKSMPTFVTDFVHLSKTKNSSYQLLREKDFDSNFDFECKKYYEMMKFYGFSDQGKMNNYISRNKLWDDFPTIRAYNTHGNIENIKGITPKAYARVCELQGRSIGGSGRPLIASKRY